MTDMATLYALKARIVAFEAEIALAEMEIKGGAGSGNWGHAGRPGKRGGSASKGGGSSHGKRGGANGKTKQVSPAQTKQPKQSGESTDPKTWKDRLSESEMDAVANYAGSGYLTINKGLRTGKLSKQDQKTVQELDKALAKSKLASDETLYEKQTLFRAAEIPAVNEAIKNGKLNGLEFTDDGFVSTTTNKAVADNFNRSDNGRMFIINAPKGTNAAPVSDLGLGLKGEDEILLARKTKFRVSGVEKRKEKYEYRDMRGKTKKGTRTVEYIIMDVIGQG